jgi:hypothetical protein
MKQLSSIQGGGGTGGKGPGGGQQGGPAQGGGRARKDRARGASTGREGPGGGELDECIMHRVHTNAYPNSERNGYTLVKHEKLSVFGEFKRVVDWRKFKNEKQKKK